MLRSLVCMAALLLGGVGWGDDKAPAATATAPAPVVPPTTPEEYEQSRRDYAEGARLYQQGEYDLALKRFQAAYRAAPSPEFWFNIARCHERLGRWAEAAAAYESYLAGKPNVDDAVQIRERISDLRVRAAEVARLSTPPPPSLPPPAPSSPPPRASLRVPALALLGVTVALGAGGAGAWLSEWSDYSTAKSACMSSCSPQSVDGLRTRVHQAEVAAGVLWAFAGAALVADVILWAIDARQRRERNLPSLRAGVAAVTF